MKKQLVMTAAAVLFALNIYAQTSSQNNVQSASPGADRNGFRIFSPYFGAFASVPMGDFGANATIGGGVRFGTMFNFTKNGFADGLLNVGIKTEWVHFEVNLISSNNLNDNTDVYLGLGQNYGPYLTLNPAKAFYIDFFVAPGWGERMASNDNSNDNNFHIRFVQSYGVNFRFKALYTGLNIMHYNGYSSVTSEYDNYYNTYYNHDYLYPGSTTFQITVGVCGWKVRNK